MSETELPLFAWCGSVKIIAFPCNKRIGKVRRVSEILMNRKSDAARLSYWNRTINTLTRQMKRAQISDSQIQIELNNFQIEVEKEMTIIANQA